MSQCLDKIYVSDSQLPVDEKYAEGFNFQIKSKQKSLFKQNTRISTYTVILKINKSKTPFIILAQG